MTLRQTTPVILRAEGLALGAAGDPASATKALRGAVAEFERLRYPFEVAQTLDALAGLVDRPEATDLRAKALAIYETLGARPHMERLRAVLSSPARPGRYDGAIRKR